MKDKQFAIFGILFIALGIAGFVHPRILMPGKQNDVQVGGQQMIVETRRVIEIPAFLSGFFILAGGALIFLSGREKPSGTSGKIRTISKTKR
jgi:hypothetical protein